MLSQRTRPLPAEVREVGTGYRAPAPLAGASRPPMLAAAATAVNGRGVRSH